MELTIESGYTRITDTAKEELQIIILSGSVLQAWQLLQKEKAFYMLSGRKQYNITLVDKETEKKNTNTFLLLYKRSSRTQKEMLWLQSFDASLSSYLNIPLKLSP